MGSMNQAAGTLHGCPLFFIQYIVFGLAQKRMPENASEAFLLWKSHVAMPCLVRDDKSGRSNAQRVSA